MKKSMFMLLLILLLSFMVCNIYKVVAQKSFYNFMNGNMEVLGEVECGNGETKGYIIGKESQHCFKHNEKHEWKNCVMEKDKCCDPKLKTSKPACLGLM